MRRSNSIKSIAITLASASVLVLPLLAHGDVCQQGMGIPPFLSSGAKPNLLMALDNSGSMLDTAYVATTTTMVSGQPKTTVDSTKACVDNSFDPSKTYVGLFEEDKWYRWVDSIPQWISGRATPYVNGDQVVSEGIVYRATEATGNISTGWSVEDDTAVHWVADYYIPPWSNGTVYAKDSFVTYDNQVFRASAAGTANDPNTADGISVYGDTGIVWSPVDSTWVAGKVYTKNQLASDRGMLFRNTTGVSTIRPSLDKTNWEKAEGHFVKATFGDSAGALTASAGHSGDAYSQPHLVVKITSVDVSGSTVQSGVSFFAASGKLLNWASASKFDIEKKILTGGKFEEPLEVLIGQGRGCSSRNFIKEVPVTKSGGGNRVLTLAHRGASDDDWVDTLDQTSRLAILGVSASGFIGSERQQACQAAIDEVGKGDQASLGVIKTNTKTCLDYSTTLNNVAAASNAAFNHSVQSCWFYGKKHYTSPDPHENISSIEQACQHIYDGGYPPSVIDPWDSGYMCYGIYNQTLPDAYGTCPAGLGSPRSGYIGRCWEPSALPVGCQGVACTGPTGTGNDPRCFSGLLYDCTGKLDKDGECPTNKSWRLVLENDGDPLTPSCDTTAIVGSGGWTDDNNPNSAENCIREALWDYCGSLKIPEVIDPSDLLSNTNETWGMVGAMIDSGVAAMFGSGHQLLVMKSYIRETSTPQGILHTVAKDIRMGVMAFNNNGSEYECENFAATSPTITKYCPKPPAVNRDGAKVIAAIKEGDAINPSTQKQHIEELAKAINDTRAATWTPLAEAFFNALGYYGQNASYRLNETDFTISATADPVQYWCQQNYVLMITEGASTADLNQRILERINHSGLQDPTTENTAEKECVNTAGQSDLFGSTYLDDLTYMGYNASHTDIYTTRTIQSDDGISYDKRPITTYMVVTGAPRDDGTADECNPALLMANASSNGGTSLLSGEDPAALEQNLLKVFSDILNRASAGSAASVISNSRSGEGGVYQAIFWPEIDRGVGKEPLRWVGDVHAFFLDEHGMLWDDYSGNATSTIGELWSEDTNGNGLLDPNEDRNNNGVLDGDRRIRIFYNNDDNVEATQICFNPEEAYDAQGNRICKNSDYYNTPAAALDLRDFDRYLWSAKVQLDNITDINTNRAVLGDGTWNFSSNRRYIFTWNDLDNDGVVDTDLNRDGAVDNDGDGLGDQEEVLDVVPGLNTPPRSVANAVSPRNLLHRDFNAPSTTYLDYLVRWIRGEDIYEDDSNGNNVLEPVEDLNGNGLRDYLFRCRKYPNCDPAAVNNPPWRLGDVIHSTPTLVSRPSEGYHLIYGDQTYANFYKKYVGRRNVIYFGSNDGMLHAVNGGFYQAGVNKFHACREDQRDPATQACLASAPYDINPARAYPALGDELWAYIPYNLQPHLACLTDPNYSHKYFVDAPPRVFDARIFPDDTVHPDGWGTILVGYMRFGGAPILADSAPSPVDKRKFISAYFILDITDPERPPTLLAEMTSTTETLTPPQKDTSKFTEMGFTTGMPTLVAMRDKATGNSEWFLVLGNGPTTVKGENDLQGKIAVIPLNAITGVNWKQNGDGTYFPTARKAFRIPNALPGETPSLPHFGRYLIEPDSQDNSVSFVGDMVSADFNIREPQAPGKGVPYKSDAVYFGTTDGEGFDVRPTTGHSFWNGGGRLFRLVTRAIEPSGEQVYLYPEHWHLEKMLDAQAPITAAPNIGYDGSNIWIYAGTGRFLAPEDKTDDKKQYFFGVKEPRDTECRYSWNTVAWWSPATSAPIAPNPSATPGSQGLFRTDQARVIESDPTNPMLFKGNYLYCDGCSYPQLSPVIGDDVDDHGPYYAFESLRDYIVGENCDATQDSAIGVDGWYREFTSLRERSLGMPALLGGIVTYTSYQPSTDVCLAEGLGYLYGVYYLTGTAWHENLFGTDSDLFNREIVRDRLGLGQGLVTTPSLQSGGGPNDVNAFIQTSTGAIVPIGQNNLPLSNYKNGTTSWKRK